MKKIALFLTMFFLISLNAFSQSEDYFEMMGVDRTQIIDLFKEYERIYTGNYSEVVYGIDENTFFSFGFDESNKCNNMIIKKEKRHYEDIVLKLSSKFPNKNIGKIDLFWNSRMMVAIVKEKEIINISYSRINPSLLEKK